MKIIEELIEKAETSNTGCVSYGGREYTKAELVSLFNEIDPLNEKEREYLRNVIKPFRDRVEYIKKDSRIKFDDEDDAYEFIEIVLTYGEGAVHLPYFESGEHYKGMQRVKYYTIEELGL